MGTLASWEYVMLKRQRKKHSFMYFMFDISFASCTIKCKIWLMPRECCDCEPDICFRNVAMSLGLANWQLVLMIRLLWMKVWYFIKLGDSASCYPQPDETQWHMKRMWAKHWLNMTKTCTHLLRLTNAYWSEYNADRVTEVQSSLFL